MEGRSKITSVTGKRLDHFAQLLYLTRRSLSEENRRLQILHRKHHATNKIISITIEDIHLAIVNLHQIDSIYQALLQLSKGHLSYHLLNSTLLTTGIKDMSEKHKSVSPEHELIYTDPNYYYTRATVGGAIHKDRNTHVLLVIIQAPIVLRKAIVPLNVWKITYFALKFPDNEGFYSILNNGLKFVAHSKNNSFYFTANDANGLFFYITAKRKVAEHLVKFLVPELLFTKNKLTCALALMDGNLSDMKMLCELHLLYRTLTPAVHILSDGKLLVTNISKVKIVRKGRIKANSTTGIKYVTAIDKTLENSNLQYIISLPCETRAYINDAIYFTQKHCNPEKIDQIINTTFPINMVVLKQYFGNHSMLSDLNTALELNQTLPVELPPILVESIEFDHILAKEDKARFDFNTALNSSIKQKRIYSDLSTVLYEKINQLVHLP